MFKSIYPKYSFYSQYEYINEIFYSSFMLSLWNLVCILYSQHILLWTSHISSTHKWQMTYIGQCRSRIYTLLLKSKAWCSHLLETSYGLSNAKGLCGRPIFLFLFMYTIHWILKFKSNCNKVAQTRYFKQQKFIVL